MKKLLLLVFGLGLIVASCGSKESQVSSGNNDSMTVTADTSTTATTDSVPMQNPDTMSMPTDSTAVPVR